MNEALIDEAAAEIYGAVFGHVPEAFEPDALEDWRQVARAAFAVFRKHPLLYSVDMNASATFDTSKSEEADGVDR